MRFPSIVSVAVVAAAALGGGGASAANICQTDRLTCATTMPVDGYCECTSHGKTEDGTVVTKQTPRRPVNSTAGGCGAQASGPGCR